MFNRLIEMLIIGKNRGNLSLQIAPSGLWMGIYSKQPQIEFEAVTERTFGATSR
jgi:hypothetical protein